MQILGIYSSISVKYSPLTGFFQQPNWTDAIKHIYKTLSILQIKLSSISLNLSSLQTHKWVDDITISFSRLDSSPLFGTGTSWKQGQ